VRTSALNPFDQMSRAVVNRLGGVAGPSMRLAAVIHQFIPGLRAVTNRIGRTLSQHPVVVLSAAYWLTLGAVDLVNDWLLLGLTRPLRPLSQVGRDVTIWWLTWVPLTPFIVRAAQRWPFDRGAIVRSVGLHLSISVAAAGVHLLIAALTFQFLYPMNNSVGSRLAVWAGGFTLTEFLVCWGLLAIVGATHTRTGPRVAPAPEVERAAKFFTVRDKERILLVPVDSVDWLEAVGNYVRLHVGGSQHLVRGSLKSTLERLDSHRFVQIHRSTVVNVERIHQIEPWFSGDYLATLSTGEQLKVSRTFRRTLLEPLI